MLPAIAFTSIPEFHDPTSIRGKIRDLMIELKVHSWQVVHSSATRDAADIKAYTAESKDLTIHALLVWNQHPNVGLGSTQNLKILTDEGNAFKDSVKGSVLETFGWNLGWIHQTFPPAVHHYLSTLDNGVNSTIKRNFHAKMRKLKDQVSEAESVIWMLYYCNKFAKEQVKSYWTRNFFLKSKNVASITEQHIMETFWPNGKIWHGFHDECDKKYEEWLKNHTQELSMPIIGMSRRREFNQNGPKAVEPSKRRKSQWQEMQEKNVD